ncbi:MAG: hypothetical protein AAF633_28410, partial [Chloroflexota bacterium]
MPIRKLIPISFVLLFGGLCLFLVTESAQASNLLRKISRSDASIFTGSAQFLVSPDGQHIIIEETGINFLYASLAAPELEPAVIFSSTTSAYNNNVQFSPDSRHIFYQQRSSDSFTDQIYRQPVDGGEPIGMIDLQYNVDKVSDFLMTPDNQRLVFATYTNTVTNTISSTNYKIYTSPLAGGEDTLLHTIEEARIQDMVATSDSNHLVFQTVEYRNPPDG